MTTYTIIGAAVLAAATIAAVVIWRKKRAAQKVNREKMEQKMREDALDRALSNQLHRSSTSEAQAPIEIRYSGMQAAPKDVEMIRLTEKAETMTKEYLFHKSQSICIGEEHGRAAVYSGKTGKIVHYEIFTTGSATYVRCCGRASGRLVRGKRDIALDTNGIRLASNDVLETRCGVFLVEFI